MYSLYPDTTLCLADFNIGFVLSLPSVSLNEIGLVFYVVYYINTRVSVRLHIGWLLDCVNEDTKIFVWEYFFSIVISCADENLR